MAKRWAVLFSVWLLGSVARPVAAAAPAEAERWNRPSEIFEKTARSLDQQPAGLRYSELRFFAGNDPRFAARDWDDSDWKVLANYQDIPARTGIYWIRFRVRLDDSQPAFDDGFQVTAAASYRIYWDGVLIGHSGQPGSAATQEIVGPLDNLFTLPPSVRGRGEHVVAMQMSAYKNHFPEHRVHLLCFSGPVAALQTKLLMAAAFPVIGAAALCMLALSSWVIWIMGLRNPALGWFAAMCTFAALFQAILAARFLTGYLYTWALPMIILRGLSLGATGFALVMFVAARFERRTRQWIAAGVGIAYLVATVILGFRSSLLGAELLTVASSIALVSAAWSAWKSPTWSNGLIAIGVGVVVAQVTTDPRAYSSTEFSPRFLPSELCLMGVLGAQVRNERRRVRDMQLHSARLEIELLKKNLQPHFLFNTLTAVSEVIEQTPSAAGALIEDLTEEFRALTRLSGEKLIPISQELTLCHTHLRVVSRRMGIAADLKAENPTEGLMIPPAILLTLIENAFVHQAIVGSNGTFRLQVQKKEAKVMLLFFSPGEIKVRSDRGEGGTGLRYVRARLEESFPGAWSFADQVAPGGWETCIEFVASGKDRPASTGERQLRQRGHR